jgi:DNA-binding MarR family transcriptional regulator
MVTDLVTQSVDEATDQNDERLTREAILLLPEIGKCVIASIVRHPRLEGFTVPQIKAMAFVAHHAPCTVGELANGLGVAMATASEAVDRLAERSLIERQHDPADRRRVMIALTEQGQCLADEMWAIRQRQMRETFARLPAEDRAVFVNALNVLVGVLREQVGATAGPASLPADGWSPAREAAS